MSQNSAIEWTEATWNPVRGCVKVSPGCANCYAKTFAERWRGVPGHAYEQGFDLRLVPEKLDEPLRRKKPTTYFVNSMSDLFQDGVPDEFIDQVFGVMALAQQHTFQVLTKRADRMRAYFDVRTPEDLFTRWADAALTIQPLGDGENATDEAASRYEDVFSQDWPLLNVWLGVSVENQHFADERIPLLLDTPAAVRFISAEPLLGAVVIPPSALRHFVANAEFGRNSALIQRDSRVKGYSEIPNLLHLVIVGCESGHGRRNQDGYEEHARSLLGQCAAAGVARFHKQMPIRGRVSHDPAEWPEDLRVREMPRTLNNHS